MRKIRSSGQGRDIPAILPVEMIACSLFAVNTMLRKIYVQPLHDQLFRSAVGLGNQIDVGLVFGSDAAIIEVADERSCFESNSRSGAGNPQINTGWELAHFCSPS